MNNQLQNDVRQLLIKLGEQYGEIFPINFIENISDKQTGEILPNILGRYNHLYTSYIGDKQTARLSIPQQFRRPGIYLTYITPKQKVVTEYYIGSLKDCQYNDKFKDDKNWQINIISENYINQAIPPKSITLKQLDDEIINILLAERKGNLTVYNFPDNEDIEAVEEINVGDENVKINNLKFKDRPANNLGMGYIILRQTTNMILTQEDFVQPNTIYEIRYNFNLNGQTIDLLENCILRFNGGAFNNGVLNGDNTIIEGEPNFNVELIGSFKTNNKYFDGEWRNEDGTLVNKVTII